MKTATVTFHSSHNYGSMLQAYALQKALFNLGVRNDIINLRTDRQRAYYPAPGDYSNLHGWKKWIYPVVYTPYKKALQGKFSKFEDFLKNDLQLTKEYVSLDEILSDALTYDCYIAGSDQIWNTKCIDFDWTYFLPFEQGRKIAYAPSMGPWDQDQDRESILKIKRYLSDFYAWSVRETKSADLLEKMTGKDRPEIVVDPTLLHDSDFWKSHLVDKQPLIDEPYIYLYTVGYGDGYAIADFISRSLDMPVVVSDLHVRSLVRYNSMKRVLDVGPWEFLNLVKYAKCVVSGSFHAIVFSILFNVPFWAVNGNRDNRMSNILNLTNLESRSITRTDKKRMVADIYHIDYTGSDKILKQERERSLEFLRKALLS